MSRSVLFDTSGNLLPPEQCNIKPLESLTKDRARSPSRRSPRRNDRHSSGSDRNPSPRLPNFVQEVAQNREAANIRLASPKAVKIEHLKVRQHRIITNSESEDGKHLKNNLLPYITAKNLKPSVLSSAKLKLKMDSDTNEDKLISELTEKPVLDWNIEDVAVWLDYIGLSKYKERFHSHKVTGKTLFNLSYETLEELNLSGSSEERESFLAEVYNLLQESGQVVEEEQEADKEIEETLQNRIPQENNNGHHTMLSLNTGSDLTPTDSFASSSRTGSDVGSSPTLEMGENDSQKVDRQDTPKSTDMQNKSVQPPTHTIASKQVSPSKTKSKKDSSKQVSKKSKTRGTRFSRVFNSIHRSHKDPSLLHTAPPIYKNAFHNLMNTGPQGVIKIWTEMFLTDMQYVSLLVKHEATAFDVVKMVLEKSNAKEDPECYRICEINEHKEEYILDRNECPLQRERQWSDPDNCRFELRWRNERLIEWGNTTGSIAQDLSKQKISDEPSQGNHIEAHQDKTSSPPSSASTSDADSPQSNDDTRNDVMETEFAYIVEVDHRKGLDTSTTKDTQNPEKTGVLPNDDQLQNDFNSKNIEEPDSSQAAAKRLTSSCPDLSSNNLQDVDPEYGNLLISKNFNFLNGESDLASAGLDDEPSANIDVSSTMGEFEYSQQLRRSSKRLSQRLRLRGKPRIEGQAVEIGVDMNYEETVSTVGDSTDGKESRIHEPEGNAELPLSTPNDPQVGQQGLSASLNGGEDVSKGNEVESVVKGSGVDIDSLEPGNKDPASTPVLLPEANEVFARIKELQDENLLLVEDNRELKKNCRTFEGKSRLKERELEEMELEKNELAGQVQEMAAELHSLRAANTELRAEVDDANTKLGDVDGWVTRDVFEDIRGQLSVSLEEVEKKEEEVREIERKCKILEVENNKMKELEVEVEKLNEKIKEDGKVQDGIKKDAKDKQKQILELELESQRMQSSLNEKENEKQDAEKRSEEVEAEMERLKKSHADLKRDLQKKISDREYEILIMKEEKKELCVKMKSFENNVETLREEMKKKEAEHAAFLDEMEKQSAIKDESLSVTVSNLEQLVNERDARIKQLKKQIALSGAPQSELQAREHEYEQNKVYLKHLIALVKEKDPSILDALNKTLSSRDSDDWC